MIISLFGTLLSVIGAILSPVGLIVAGLSAVAYVVYKEWDGIKQILVDIANYFIELYNESTAFAMVVHGIGAFFKTLYDVAVAVIDAIVSSFQRGMSTIRELFGGLGDIIMGIFTFDEDMISDGLSRMGRAVKDNFTGMMDDVNGVFEKAGDSAMKNFIQGTADALGREKVELITTDDIDEFTKQEFEIQIQRYFAEGMDLYQAMLDKGIAKECARFVLPLATPTRIYMTGTLRSWMHYIDLRSANGTQKEHMDIANQCKCTFAGEFPAIAEALGWTEHTK